jgi:high-affinity iron transporter
LNGGGGWGVFNAILGWQNSATYGSVISYNVYWIAVITGFGLLRFNETKGHLPFMKAKAPKEVDLAKSTSPSSSIFENRSENNLHAVTVAPAGVIPE